MIKRLISFFLALVFLVAVPLSARYRYNPYTRKLDWYEAAGDIVLGDVGDVTLAGLANGDLLYYNGTAWVNLPVGAGATVLTVAAGIPSWQAAGAPAAHAASHEVGGADLVDHDQLTNYLAAQHLTLPNTLVAVLTDHNAAAHVALGFLALPSTIAAVLTDHNLLAHTALGLFDQSSDVDHNLTTNYLAAQHLTLPSTIVAVLTDHNKAAHDALLIDADTVDGEHAAAIVTNARVKAHFPDTIVNILSDHNLAAHTALGLFDASIDVDHNATTNYAANQHVVLPATIAAVLTDHNLAAHTALGLFDASIDVDHDATTNWVANKHIDHTAVSILSGGLITGGGTIDGNQTLTLTEATIEAAIDTLGSVIFTGAVDFTENISMTWGDATDKISLVQLAVAGIEDVPLINIDDDRTGATANELSEATIFLNAAGVYALNIEAGQAYFQDDTTQIEDVFFTWADAADHAVIAQAAVTGTEDQPLIHIDDDRTGDTASEVGEASLVITAAGSYALNIADGYANFADRIYATGRATLAGGAYFGSDAWIRMGTGDLFSIKWDTNTTGDALALFYTGAISGATNSTLLFISNLDPAGMTDHDDYLSPTLVITNDEAADANDYAGVVIGERAQASVLIAHYFDFYAMTGAADGSVDPNAAELAAIFRFGASGTAVPGYATTPGDVLFEGSQEVDGTQHIAGYRRADTVSWNDCFDHGTVASKYQFDWDITSLNTQGNGANTVDTTPSEITLTTDNNAIGDNEGTRTEFAVIQRARQNRTEWSLDLKQTANTQFFMGWNTSGTNAMVAAADEYVIVFFDVSDNANWQIKVGDGATEDVFTSGVAGAVAHIIHEVWVETDGTVHWRVNGTELDITGSVDNLMTASDHYLIVGQAQSVTGAAVIVVEIDYVENEKTKAH